MQIHHTGKCHWVTSSSIGDHVAVYDSLYSGLSEDLTVQLAQCYRDYVDGMGELHVDVPPVQQQRGATDCGLFGIAFASELAKGENLPKDITFNQSRMRSHLLQCFENDELMPFPRHHKPSKRKRGYELEVIRTFCTCV